MAQLDPYLRLNSMKLTIYGVKIGGTLLTALPTSFVVSSFKDTASQTAVTNFTPPVSWVYDGVAGQFSITFGNTIVVVEGTEYEIQADLDDGTDRDAHWKFVTTAEPRDGVVNP